MIKLLLVDDERIVAEAIESIIDWRALGIEYLGACDNAIDALAFTATKVPDIIITDIRMPVMDGLEFIHCLREKHPDISFVILSGYQEFDFAKRAMKEGVRHYLLKPFGEKEIQDVLRLVIKEIQDKRSLQDEAERGRQLQQSLLRDHLALMVLGSQLDRATRASLGRLLAPHGALYWLIGKIEYTAITSAIYRRFDAFASESGLLLYSPVYCISGKLGALLLGPHPPQRAMADALASDLDISDMKITPCTAESFPKVLRETCGSYTEVTCVQADKVTQQHIAAVFEEAEVNTAMQELEQQFKQCDPPAIQSQLTQLLLQGDAFFSVVLTKLIMHRFYQGLIDALSMTDLLNTLHECSLTGNLPTAFAEKLCIRVDQDAQCKNFVDRIVEYMGDHLSDPKLSLQWCAKHLVFMNDDYVGKTFHSRMGMNFSAYLNQIRIKRAKFLIQTLGSDKIYTVAEQIGFGHNPRYFSKFFKKQTGMTPKEYRLAHDTSIAREKGDSL